MPAFARRRERRRGADSRAIDSHHDAALAQIGTGAPAEKPHVVREWFGRAAQRVTAASGSVWAFAAAVGVIVAWAATGPIFGFSDTWQLVINTGTTIVTFLMVFLIQHSQNRDTKALHIKLNELIAAMEGASNHLIDVEDLSEDELDRLQARFQKLAEAVREMHGTSRGSGEDAALRSFKENLDRKYH